MVAPLVGPLIGTGADEAIAFDNHRGVQKQSKRFVEGFCTVFDDEFHEFGQAGILIELSDWGCPLGGKQMIPVRITPGRYSTAGPPNLQNDRSTTVQNTPAILREQAKRSSWIYSGEKAGGFPSTRKAR